MTAKFVTQFVCFDSPLPRLAFLPLWKPFATAYVEQGLARIVLYQRVGPSTVGDAPDFFSRNQWPATAFDHAVAAGRVGEGGGWPVRATQGGTFSGVNPDACPEVVAVAMFALARDRDQVVLERAIANVGAAPYIYAPRRAGAPARFEAVVEVTTDRHAGSEVMKRLAESVAPHARPHAMVAALYERALVLPSV